MDILEIDCTIPRAVGQCPKPFNFARYGVLVRNELLIYA